LLLLEVLLANPHHLVSKLAKGNVRATKPWMTKREVQAPPSVYSHADLRLVPDLACPFDQSDASAWRFLFALWWLLPRTRIGARTLAEGIHQIDDVTGPLPVRLFAG
jgi:hypothetical protein